MSKEDIITITRTPACLSDSDQEKIKDILTTCFSAEDTCVKLGTSTINSKVIVSGEQDNVSKAYDLIYRWISLLSLQTIPRQNNSNCAMSATVKLTPEHTVHIDNMFVIGLRPLSDSSIEAKLTGTIVDEKKNHRTWPSFEKDIIENQQPLGPEFQKVIDENWDDLI